MRFQKVNLKQSTMNDSVSESEGNKNVSHCVTEESPFSEIRKSLDIVQDVFSELPGKDVATMDAIHAESDASKGRIAITASEMLQLLSKGGINHKDHPGTTDDLSQDSISGCSTSSSEALLQLVHTDHPYLCKTQEADDTEECPDKSGSCSSIPDPEIIHDFFLHTTNMISYQPMTEVGGVSVPSPVPTLIGSPHLTCKTNPDPQLASSEGSSEGSENNGEAVETPKENARKFPSSEEFEKSVVISDQPNALQPSEKDNDQTEELEQKETSNQNPIADDDETKQGQTKTNEEPTDLEENMKSSNSKEGTVIEQSNHDQDTTHDTSIILQTDESSVFSNMVKPSSLNQIDPNSWTAACKAVADKVQEESLVHCAASMMLKVWTDYLSLTFEEVRARELQASRNNNYTDDVIAMIEDKDRYVWQLIEEMEPRNFQIDF